MDKKLVLNREAITAIKVYYLVTAISVIVFVMGMMLAGTENSIPGVYSEPFSYITMFIPFCLWLWLLIIGILFIKKNWIVNAILVILAIPQIIFAIVLSGFSYSFTEILSWYGMLLTFGLVVIR